MAKVVAEQFLSGLGEDITSPFLDRRGVLHFLLQNAGVIVRLDESAGGKISTVHSTEGQPSGAVCDRISGGMYVADFGHCAVLSVSGGGEQDSVVAVYEDRPLKGPNSVCMDMRGNVFFTDSGPIGETGLAAPFGSLFMIASSPGGQILKPISLNNLAYPSGIACAQDGSFM
jgi:aspartate beta-hydroxylase